MNVDLAEFRGAFLSEAEELLAAANAQLLAVEEATRRGDGDVRGVRELFRAVHTIKGLAAMVGVEAIVVIAHRMETILRLADRAGARLATRSVDVLLQGVRAIEQSVKLLADGKAIVNPPAALLDALDELEAAASAPAAAPARQPAGSLESLEPGVLAAIGTAERDQIERGRAEGKRLLRIDFAPSSDKSERGFTITSVRERLGRMGDIVKVVPSSVPPSPGAPGGLVFQLLVASAAEDAELAAATGAGADAVRTLLAAAPRSTPGPPPATDEPRDPASAPRGAGLTPLVAEPVVEVLRPGVVRVEVSRLDQAMERLSSLIVTRFRLARATEALAEAGAPEREVRDLREILVENARQLRDLRAAILRLRMVPMAEVLDRLPLLIRGLSRSTGKPVRLAIAAGNAEIDKSVGERLFPAIIHLVRNAVDHAIEPLAERRRAGKPDEGQVTITCSERSNTQIEITLADDGAGIDRERVESRAGRAAPTDAALLELLCLPGLSTRDEANATSGRGMGMDIVKRTIVDQLGGELRLATERGRGTTFTLVVPLTISIVDAFTFEAAAQRFVVPVATVEEIVEIDAARVVRPPGQSRSAAGATLIERRGESMPLVRLDVVLRCRTEGEPRKALVVRRNGEALAFAVDRMVAQQEVVVRPLEDPLVRVPGVTGATDLGDGRPTLVLDLSSLGATLAPEVLS